MFEICYFCMSALEQITTGGKVTELAKADADAAANKGTAGKQTRVIPGAPKLKGFKIVRSFLQVPTYEQWLSNVRKSAPKLTVVDRVQKRVDPKLYDQYANSLNAYAIRYRSGDVQVSGIMAYPKEHGNKALPVLIYNRGGNSRHNWNTGSIFSQILPFAEQGYLVLASDYRGSRYSQGKDQFGGDDVKDVVALTEQVKNIPFADVQSIQMLGASRGAMMTLMAAKQLPELKSITVMAVISDMALAVKNRPEIKQLLAKFEPELKIQPQKELARRSAVKWLDELSIKTPIMIMHGTQDMCVSVQHAKMLAKGLEQKQHPHQLVLYANGDHALTFYRQQRFDD